MDLVDLVFDEREDEEQLEIGKVNKGIADSGCNLVVELRCNRIQLVNHRKNNRDEEEVRIVGLEVVHCRDHYHSHFAYVVIAYEVIDVLADESGSYPALHPDAVLRTGSNLADSSVV